MIRRLGAADAAAYAALRLAGIRAHPEAFLPTAEEAEAMPSEAVAKRLSDGMVFGAFDGDTLVGFIGVNPHGYAQMRHAAEIGPVYVVPARRGDGTADALLRAAMAGARADGVERLSLWVAEANSPAGAFYARHGFEVCGRLEDAVRLPDGTRVTDLLMAARAI